MQEEMSTITAGSFALVLFLGILLIGLPRRYAMAPLLVAGCYMTLGQVLIVGGLHFYLIRILILFGFVRLLARKELFSIQINTIDRILIAWAMVNTFLYVLFDGTDVHLSERLGFAYNAFGIYFLIRGLVRDLDDVVRTVKILGVMVIPLAGLFLVEYITLRNPFNVFDGVSDLAIIRDGKPRCTGPFRHPILAGTFGATAVPLFVGLWVYDKHNRLLAVGAILAATVIVVTSSSSGPVLAYLASLIGIACWALKSHMRMIRWGIVVALVAAHLLMNAPVWFLMARLSGIMGGTGWYRSELIDAFINHFDEWWLIGTAHTSHWMLTGVAINPNAADIVNHFVAQGINGGLLGLSLFIWLIVYCFKMTGHASHPSAGYSFPELFMIWCLGCTLFSHVVSFMSVSYFDQITIFWYMIIGMIVVLMKNRKQSRHESRSLKNQHSVLHRHELSGHGI
jgi:hypothetical protein